MPLSPQERAELEALKSEQGSAVTDGDVGKAQQGQQGDDNSNSLMALLQGFGNRASFGNLAKLQGLAERGVNAVAGDPSAGADAKAMAAMGPGANIQTNRDAPEQAWQKYQEQTEKNDPTAYGAGGLAGDVASGVALGGGVAGLAGKAAGVGGRVAQVASSPIARAAVEGATSGLLDPNGSVAGGAVGGAAMGAVGKLVGSGLKAGGKIARSVDQFQDSAGSLDKAKQAFVDTKQGLWDVGAPARAAKIAELEKMPPIRNYGDDMIAQHAAQYSDDATRPIATGAGNAGKAPEFIPASEAERIGREAQKNAKSLKAPTFALDPALQIKNSEAAKALEAKAQHYLPQISEASPEIGALNGQISEHAGLATGLDDFNKDPLAKLLRAKAGTTDRGVLEKVEKLTGKKDMSELADTLQRGKSYNFDSIADALSSVGKAGKGGMRLASEASELGNRAFDKTKNVPLRNILLNLSRDRGSDKPE